LNAQTVVCKQYSAVESNFMATDLIYGNKHLKIYRQKLCYTQTKIQLLKFVKKYR